MHKLAYFALFSALNGFMPTIAEAGFSGPFRIATCEAMLRTDFSEFEVGLDIRPSLRDFRAKLKTSGANFDGTTFHRMKYQGLPQKMPESSRQLVTERINEIDEHLSTIRPGSHIVAREIRGWDAVNGALQMLRTNQSELGAEYSKLEKEVNSFYDHFIDWYITVAGGAFLTREWRSRWHQRRGTEIENLQNFFALMQRDKNSTDRIFVASQGFYVDHEFVQAVHRADSEVELESGRKKAIRRWGTFSNPEIVEIAKMNVLELLQRLRGGSLPQFPWDKLSWVFMDEFGYFDESTQEPVLLLVVRTLKEPPHAGRKSRVKEKGKVDSWSLAPDLQGALVPISVDR